MATPTEAVTFRAMCEDDIAFFHEWLQRPHVAEWWGCNHEAPSLNETRAKYLPCVYETQAVRPYIALLEGRSIGWTQSYVALGVGGGWWEEEADPGVRGIDQFLCDAQTLGQGLGTRMVTAFVTLLFSDPAVTRIQTDPHPENARAIRCYEKSGFHAVKRIITPDGQALLMAQNRPPLSAVADTDPKRRDRVMSDVIAAVTPKFLQAFADAWNHHDVDALMAFMTEDCVFEASAGPDVYGTRYEGQEAVRAGFSEVWATFPDAHWGNACHFVSGERGVSEWTFTGTRTDGTHVEVHGCDLFIFRDGKIALKNSYRKNRPPLGTAKR